MMTVMNSRCLQPGNFRRMSRMGAVVVMLLLLTGFKAQAIDLPNEDLNYVITYKWGFINKEAATAVLSLRNDGGHYYAQLSAQTLPWADKILCVRDTLKSTMLKKGVLPKRYTKIAHEGTRYSDDVVKYEYNGNEVTGYVTREKSKDGGPVNHSDTVLHATGKTYDMLSIFYYLRTLGFDNMTPGSKLRVNIFSGSNVEQMTITYVAEEQVKVNGYKWDTYHVQFTFTRHGVESSSPMDTWISRDEYRIPVKLVGQLTFGKVHAFFNGKPSAK